MEAYFAKVKGAGPPRCQEAYDSVERLLTKEPRNWTHAYAIEQLLVHLFDDGTLASELQVRLFILSLVVFAASVLLMLAFPDLKAATVSPGWRLDVFALLVVWCFLAGFSERLIPGLLARAEARLDTSSGSDRYRPASLTTDAANTTSSPAKSTAGAPQTSRAKAAAHEKESIPA